MLLSLDERLQHALDPDLNVFLIHLTPQVHLRVGYVNRQLPTDKRMID